MLIAQGGRVVIQGLYFVLLARCLGAVGFGLFAGALAMTGMLVPFVGWGTGNLLVMRVARDNSQFPVAWGNSLFTLFISGIFLTVIAVTLGSFLLPPGVSRTFILLMAISELCFSRLVDLSGQAFQAFERLRVTALLNVTSNLLRLLGLFVYIKLDPSPKAETWLVWYTVASAAGAIISAGAVLRLLGRPHLDPRRVPSDIKHGFYFAFGVASYSIYTDIDKTMLVRYSTSDSAGIFAAAYRVINMAFLPIQALLAASYSKFFRVGANGITGALSLVRRLLPLSAAYGMVAALGLYFLAPLVPVLLGPEYATSVYALRWLALVPFLQSFHFLFADTLTGAGLQRTRSVIQATVAFANVALNFWLIPRYSWLGAAWSTLLCETLLGVCLFGAVVSNMRGEHSTKRQEQSVN